jgi:hypothetical protein
MRMDEEVANRLHSELEDSLTKKLFDLNRLGMTDFDLLEHLKK